jgi:GntR family transcriptional regulator, transcriptional repressor for pyruvate dehydrogenase complex
MASQGLPDSALERVTRQLNSHLRELDVRRGSRLPSERAMAELFGASRSTVREAVQRLVARGLLEVRRGSGVFVTKPQIDTAGSSWLQLIADGPPLRAETLEFRSIFECCVARFAAERATPAEQERLGTVIEDMVRAVDDNDLDAEAHADAQFHLTLAAFSHNFMLSRFYASAINQLREHITHNTYEANRDSIHARERSMARLEQHMRIYRAICNRTPDEAFQAMSVHIAFVGQQFKD